MELNELKEELHQLAKEKGFWKASDDIPTKLMLIVTELGEACEADRLGDWDNFKEEVADTFIRLLDLCGHLDIDIEEEILKKHEVNKKRPKLHGKNY